MNSRSETMLSERSEPGGVKDRTTRGSPDATLAEVLKANFNSQQSTVNSQRQQLTAFRHHRTGES